MISAWTIYWVLMLDNINDIVGIIFGICLIIGIVLGVVSLITIDDNDYIEIRKRWAQLFKYYLLPLVIITSTIGIFVPTTEQMAMIYVIPKLSNSEFITKIPAKLEKLANQELDNILKKNEKE